VTAGGCARIGVLAGVLVTGMVSCGHGARPTDAECDRAAEQAAKLMDSGFAEQQSSIGDELAKLCKDPKQGWTKAQVECVMAAKTAVAFQRCAAD
jgi:hypothetical protein